ncbi:unnamed protein product [Toxocara canis]|uniref:DUF5678 domain-containing protein n=1 Tax=Toxocara canis TaxID=6265 RepID=A0A183V1E2_TOXCA|nr:unnamed protein product [Toxocara canis]
MPKLLHREDPSWTRSLSAGVQGRERLRREVREGIGRRWMSFAEKHFGRMVGDERIEVIRREEDHCKALYTHSRNIATFASEPPAKYELNAR